MIGFCCKATLLAVACTSSRVVCNVVVLVMLGLYGVCDVPGVQTCDVHKSQIRQSAVQGVGTGPN